MKKFKFTYNTALFLIWIVIFAFIGIKAPNFLKPNYLVNVMLKNIVEKGIVALPMTLIIITAGIDLSVSNILVLSCMLGAMVAGVAGEIPALLISLVVGAACGILNGLIISKVKISPMVTTLATMYLYLGLARGLSEGESVYSYNVTTVLGTTKIGEFFPIQIVIFIILAIVFVYLLHSTAWGRKLYAVGLNPNAAEYAGINTNKLLMQIYTIAGIISALAGLIFLGRFTSVKYDAGTNFNLNVITIVVLGGTSINGGVGNMKGTLLATLIIATLNSGLTVLNIPIDVQTIVQGVVLMIALIAYAVVSVRSKKKKILKVEETPEAVA